MSAISRFFSSRWGPVVTGLAVGILAPILVALGNPGNMGVCVACFSRDTAGALGLHRAAVVQYIRPELIGFVLGAFILALATSEFRPRTGSAPIVRFLLGMFSAIGALVFLGCPWRAYLRLAGGDLNAVFGILGLVGGIAIGVWFLTQGYSLGRTRPAPKVVGWMMPGIMVVLLLLVVLGPKFGRDAQGNPVGPIFFSEQGPGSMRAPIFVSLAVGLVVGALAQRSRYCTVGAIRDVLLVRDPHLFWGVVALVVAAFVTNLLLGQFKLGIEGQPVAHTNALWNFMGMVLAGLAYTMAGGCPGRQFFMAGEGDADAGIFVLGMIVGAAFAHNFNMASSPAGPAVFGPIGVIVGLAFCALLGFTSRDTQAL
ncbi:MAG: YedE-related selenium metabolism membrane protein [Chloroflexi bacterium]|nr:YedE-related selenium metabolism membrane protein [Chloroflexota bacterium]